MRYSRAANDDDALTKRCFPGPLGHLGLLAGDVVERQSAERRRTLERVKDEHRELQSGLGCSL
ncbi:MAG: hypothetical protein ACREXK_10480 [Gammaproteobacteria bacterium]